MRCLLFFCAAALALGQGTTPKAKPEASAASKPVDQPLSAAATASAGGAPGLLPLPHRPKTA